MTKNLSLNRVKIGKQKDMLALAIVLLMTAASLVACLPAVNAKSTFSLVPEFYPVIGVNSPTEITWLPDPDLFLTDPAYENQPTVWPDATVTFTRPDGTTDVISGPFKIRGLAVAAIGRELEYPPHIVLTYMPDVMGEWTVNFTWPGDDTYAPVTQVDTFTVGEHFPKRDSYAMLSLRPYPAIGIGQELLVNAWISPPPIVNRDIYENLTFTIRRPDGTIDYTFSMDSEHTGTVWWLWYFDAVGDWAITFEFPGDHLTNPCNITRTITVQKDPIPFPVEDTPLPDARWTFPISVFNREWRNIAGPWFQAAYTASGGSWNPYTEAPRSAHILWKADPVSGLGGYVGATADAPGIVNPNTKYTGTNVMINTIMAGRGYYNGGGNITCVDMFTGDVLWTVPGSFNVGASRADPSAGQTVARDSGVPVLYQFGSTFRVYDALTGKVTLEVPGLPAVVSGGGENLYVDPYVISLVNHRLIKWDTTGRSANFADRIVWNITMPFTETMSSTMRNSKIYNNLLINREFRQEYYAYTDGLDALNLTTGELEWSVKFDTTKSSEWIYAQGADTTSCGDGLYYFAGTAYPTYMDPPNGAGGYIAFDAETGETVWTSEPFDYPWGNFFCYSPQANAYGMIYSLSYSGVDALNSTNGEIVWHYSAGNSGMETPYNTWPFGSVGAVVGGGIVFAPSTEHSVQVYYRGFQLHAIDAFTGDKIWSIMGYYTPTAIAYGVLVAAETSSGFTYAFGKGETAVTVSTSSKVVAKGSGLLIEGTVTDQSSAQLGTAAVSDDSMTGWMEYLHMQQPKPTNTTGVTVKLTAVDQDGNKVDIGTTTSDSDGLYAYMWTPSDTGTYKVTASFEGSNSYYASYAETAVGVTAAPAASVSPSGSASPSSSPSETVSPSGSVSPSSSVSPSGSASPTEAPPPTESPSMDIYIIIAVVAVIAVIAAAAVVLRKRRK